MNIYDRNSSTKRCHSFRSALPEFDCVDCRRNTVTEYYMVHDTVWQHEAGMKPNGGGMLCIECLEGRIGRRLTSADFIDAPCNFETSENYSPLLQSRLASAHKSSSFTQEQVRALTLASHYNLIRHRAGWVARTDFKWGRREKIIRPGTVKALWRRGCLKATPNAKSIYQPSLVSVAKCLD
jgi:hypothetical protein